MASKEVKRINEARKRVRFGVGIPLQAPGEPSGKHMTGFKGSKVEGICRCGGCLPKLRLNATI